MYTYFTLKHDTHTHAERERERERGDRDVLITMLRNRSHGRSNAVKRATHGS